MTSPHLFIHIGKTAGTSFIDVCQSQIYYNSFMRIASRRNTHIIDFEKNITNEYLRSKQSYPNKIKGIGGHFQFGLHEKIGVAPKYSTILRNPVERVLSEYYYMKLQGFYFQKLILKNNLSIKEYLYHSETFFLNNSHTRVISGVPFEQEMNEEVFQIAVEHLKSMNVVGLTERFPETLALFYIKWKWNKIPFTTHLNSNEKKPQKEDSVTIETIEAIKEREVFDLRLYEIAKILFENEVEKNEEKIKKILPQIIHPSALTKFRIKIEKKIHTKKNNLKKRLGL